MLQPGTPASTFRTFAIGASACLALCLGACARSSSDPSGPGRGAREGQRGAQQDVASLQGRWEQLPEQPGPGSPRQRVVKEVKGNTETVTTYDADGAPVQSQTAQFRLSRPGGVPVYTFSGARVTAGAGADAEKPSAAPRSYIYKLRGGDFYEVWGLLPGQEEREVVVRHWKRQGPPGR